MSGFSSYKKWAIPEGNVVKVTDEAGNVLWAVSGGKVVLEVEKITSDTYAGGTTYTGEQFILLDIYPKTNGTVSVTYGGLTKTITDTSGVAEPNAQQVFFGKFNGVSDSVETPESGELTIEGDYYAFGGSSFAASKYANSFCCPICKVKSFGTATKIPANAFGGGISGTNFNQTSIKIPAQIESIGGGAFFACMSLQNIQISNGVKSIGGAAFSGKNLQDFKIPASVTAIGYNPVSGNNLVTAPRNNFISVAEGNAHYKIDGNCLIEIATNRLISGFTDSVIPAYVTEIGDSAFQYQSEVTSVTIPQGVTRIGAQAFNFCEGLKEVILLPTTPPTLASTAIVSRPGMSFIVPKGCGDVYKAAEVWSEHADYIVEAS